MFTGASVQKMVKKHRFDDEQVSERTKKHHMKKKVSKHVDKRKMFETPVR